MLESCFGATSSIRKSRSPAFSSNLSLANQPAVSPMTPIPKVDFKPIQYDVNLNAVKPNAPSWTGSRGKQFPLFDDLIYQQKDKPDPCSYQTHPATVSAFTNTNQNRHTNYSFGVSQRPNQIDPHITPGPGHHSLKDLDSSTHNMAIRSANNAYYASVQKFESKKSS